MRRYPDITFTIQGHASRDEGDPQSKIDLSARRAYLAKQALVDLGIPESRLMTAAYADGRPIDDIDTPAGLAQNRRVSFHADEVDKYLGACWMPLEAVGFEKNDPSLSQEAGARIELTAAYLKRFSSVNLILRGYADPKEDQDDIETLARTRAETVRQALIAAGVPAKRIQSFASIKRVPFELPERERAHPNRRAILDCTGEL
jgi:outer membrane protein OmpA-like peptidoglycan-associated protein